LYNIQKHYYGGQAKQDEMGGHIAHMREMYTVSHLENLKGKAMQRT